MAWKALQGHLSSLLALLQVKLKECEAVLENDYFLAALKDDFVENARLFIFETYCRIHQCIDMRMLAGASLVLPSDRLMLTTLFPVGLSVPYPQTLFIARWRFVATHSAGIRSSALPLSDAQRRSACFVSREGQSVRK